LKLQRRIVKSKKTQEKKGEAPEQHTHKTKRNIAISLRLQSSIGEALTEVWRLKKSSENLHLAFGVRACVPPPKNEAEATSNPFGQRQRMHPRNMNQ